MANNRMLLIHRPTGLAIVLAKHMGGGWYKAPEQDALEELYGRVAKETSTEADMEDFCLGMESCDADTPYVKTDWGAYNRDEHDSRLLRLDIPEGEQQAREREAREKQSVTDTITKRKCPECGCQMTTFE